MMATELITFHLAALVTRPMLLTPDVNNTRMLVTCPSPVPTAAAPIQNGSASRLRCHERLLWRNEAAVPPREVTVARAAVRSDRPDISALTDEQLRPYYNEYVRRAMKRRRAR